MADRAVIYVHGKGGSAEESGYYVKLFPEAYVTGLDYRTFTPWETGKEIRTAVLKLKKEYKSITLIANSIGAFFSMNAGLNGLLSEAYFISPVVDMEKLISDMMARNNVTEEELKSKGVIGELSWEYLCYIREHPVKWSVPTYILYGENDVLTRYEAVKAFAEADKAELAVMKNGEHWFHTEEQMSFLAGWIEQNESKKKGKIMNKYIAYCGLDCEKCDAFAATKNNDEELRKKTAKLWSELNGVEITPEMINCEGCRADGKKTPYCESLCPIRQCALEKGRATCGKCGELMTCGKVGMIIGNNEQALKNLQSDK